MRRTAAALLLTIVVAACGDDDGAPPSDAGMDAARDAGRPDAGFDAGCATACDFDQLCCPGPSGTFCAETQTDPDNCGLCGVVCAEGRGTECGLGRCRCGMLEEGCLGRTDSWCCPPRLDGGMDYCANLYADSLDCGSCGNECDIRRSDRCLDGNCRCGETRFQCSGEPTDVCCPDSPVPGAPGICVDTTTDRRNCGECGTRCSGLERCVAGTCVPLPDAGP